MEMWLQFLLTALGGGGVGGVFTAIGAYFITKKKSDQDLRNDDYRNIIAEKDRLLQIEKANCAEERERHSCDMNLVREQLAKESKRGDRLFALIASLKESSLEDQLELMKLRDEKAKWFDANVDIQLELTKLREERSKRSERGETDE